MQESAVTMMQNALVEWLDKEFTFMRTVEKFSGIWTEADIQRCVNASPALYVCWLNNRPDRNIQKIHTWQIILFMTTSNSELTEEEQEIANRLIEFIEIKLHGKKLSNGWGQIGGPLQHVKSESLWHASSKTAGFTLYGINFEQAMYSVIEEDYPDFLTYFEEVAEGDTTLLEVLAKPNEPMNNEEQSNE